MNALALDSGNAIIKAKSSGGEIAFVHALYQLTDAEYHRVTTRSGEIHSDYIRVNGVPYVVGERAERHGTVERRTGAARYVPEYYGVFVATALARMYAQSMRNIYLFGSHAPADVDYRDDLMGSAVGTWEVEYQGKMKTFRVSDANTFDEPLGGLMNLVLNRNGITYKTKEINDGVTLVLDVGGHTTDGLVIDPGASVDYSTAHSERIGILGVLRQFEKDFRSNNAAKLRNTNTIAPQRLRDGLRTGKMNLGGLGTFDCHEEADAACSEIVNKIKDVYNSYYGGSASYDYLVLTGGGSALLYTRLVDALGHNQIYLAERELDELHLANVRGGMNLYTMYEKTGMI